MKTDAGTLLAQVAIYTYTLKKPTPTTVPVEHRHTTERPVSPSFIQTAKDMAGNVRTAILRSADRLRYRTGQTYFVADLRDVKTHSPKLYQKTVEKVGEHLHREFHDCDTDYEEKKSATAAVELRLKSEHDYETTYVTFREKTSRLSGKSSPGFVATIGLREYDNPPFRDYEEGWVGDFVTREKFRGLGHGKRLGTIGAAEANHHPALGGTLRLYAEDNNVGMYMRFGGKDPVTKTIKNDKGKDLNVTIMHVETSQAKAMLDKLDVLESIKARSRHTAIIEQWSEGTISDQELIAYFKNAATALSTAWPKKATNDPPEFVKLAARLQREKLALFDCVGVTQPEDRADKLQTALECANLLHAKEGHNKNVVRAAQMFLELDEIKSVFRQDSEHYITELFNQGQTNLNILEAAKWHGLSDRDIPVAILAAKRALSVEDKANHIDLRSGKSAAIYRAYGMSNEEAAQLIEKTRVFGEESRKRPLAAQFLDLMDRICAMGVKPYFKPNGNADAERIFTAIEKDLRKNDVFIHPDLQDAVKTGIKNGLLDSALFTQRNENIYVRA